MFKNKKVLVAGGTGLIGIPLVEMLIKQEAEVYIVSLDDPVRAHPQAKFIREDMMNFDKCLKLCQGMDFVFNLLGVKGFPGLNTQKPASFLFPTLMLAYNLLEAARQAKVKGYIYTSSLAVYASAEVFREDDVWTTMPAKNDWFGGWAKRMGELQVEAYKIEYGWQELAIVRPANVYGPFDNFEGQNAMVVPSLIKRAISGENPLKVWGDGAAVRDFIHANDVARALLFVAEKMPEQPVNLGSGTGISIKELVEIIVANLDLKPEIVWQTDKPTGDQKRILDISRIQKLGFDPEISMEKGVKQVMDWYKENRLQAGKRYDIFDNCS